MKQQALLVTVGVSGVVALAQPSLVLAQEPALEEIIVTAQKRTERLIDVPMSTKVVEVIAAPARSGIYASE